MATNSAPVYRVLARMLAARDGCDKNGNTVWGERWGYRITRLMEQTAPSGAGLDSGVTLEDTKCTPSKLVFSTSFHHMDANGFYDGWTAHDIIVTPTFDGIDGRITGRDRNGIKDYLYEVFYGWLVTPVYWNDSDDRWEEDT